MLNKTHLSAGAFFMILFLPKVVHETSYVFVFLIATLVPNLDAVASGKRSFLLAPLKLFLKKRGMFHSFTFCLAVTLLLAWFWPVYAFPFFLGYGIHLLLDSWTVEGIKPFWPFKAISKGRITTGGGFENVLFYSFLIADAVAIWFVFF